MNKVIYIPSHFAGAGKDATPQVPTGEKKRGILGGIQDVMKEVAERLPTGYSESRVDGERLSQDISDAVDILNDEGYEVVSVTPITSGSYTHTYAVVNSAGGYVYGFSYTEGVTIVARKIASNHLSQP